MDGQFGARGFDNGPVGIGMVKMRVGVKHILDRQTVALDLGQDPVWMAAWVYDGADLGLLTSNDVAIGLDYAHG
jgi:hypothetical protein